MNLLRFVKQSCDRIVAEAGGDFNSFNLRESKKITFFKIRIVKEFNGCRRFHFGFETISTYATNRASSITLSICGGLYKENEITFTTLQKR